MTQNKQSKTEDKGLFSVIILMYNNSKYLNECLDSVLDQVYPNIEIIVVDDNSDDFDKEAIESYINSNKGNNIRVYSVYQNETNLGTVKSANNAIKQSKGRYIKLLAADDALYDSCSLSNAAEALADSPSGIIVADVMKCNKELKPVGEFRKPLNKKMNSLDPPDIFKRLCVHNGIVAGGVFFTKKFFETYGLFDERYRLLEDWPTWLSVSKKGCAFRHAPFFAVKYRSDGGIGTSSNNAYMADKKSVLDTIIVPSKKELGPGWYALSRLSYAFINSQTIRKAYSMLRRGGK